MGYLLILIGVVSLIAMRSSKKEKPAPAASPLPGVAVGVARVRRVRVGVAAGNSQDMKPRYWTYFALFNGGVIALLLAGSGLEWRFGCFFVMMALFGMLPKLIFPAGWSDREKKDHPGDLWMAFNFMAWLAFFIYAMVVA